MRKKEKREEKEKKEERMTGNRIGVEGAKAMSSMLKVNTTLTTLNLEGEEERKRERREKERMTGNEIGDKGKKMVSDAWDSHGETFFF